MYLLCTPHTTSPYLDDFDATTANSLLAASASSSPLPRKAYPIPQRRSLCPILRGQIEYGRSTASATSSPTPKKLPTGVTPIDHPRIFPLSTCVDFPEKPIPLSSRPQKPSAICIPPFDLRSCLHPVKSHIRQHPAQGPEATYGSLG